MGTRNDWTEEHVLRTLGEICHDVDETAASDFLVTADDLLTYAPHGWMCPGNHHYIIAVCQREGIPLAEVARWDITPGSAEFWRTEGPARTVTLHRRVHKRALGYPTWARNDLMARPAVDTALTASPLGGVAHAPAYTPQCVEEK